MLLGSREHFDVLLETDTNAAAAELSASGCLKSVLSSWVDATDAGLVKHFFS